MPIVQMPDGTQVNFPDTMSETSIRGLIAQKFPKEIGAAGAAKPLSERETAGHYSLDERGLTPSTPYGESYFAQGTSGLNEGLANVLGAPIDLSNAAIGLGMKGINTIAGTNLQPSAEPLGGSAGLKKSLTEIGSIRPPTDEGGKQFLRRTMQSVGSAAVPALGVAGAAAQPLVTIGSILAQGLGGGLSAATANQVLPGNQTADMLADFLGGLGTSSALTGAKKMADTAALQAKIPTVQKLEAQASAKYALAEKNGVTASQKQTQALSTDMRKIASDEGLISPTGRVSEAYPKAKEAIRLMEDYSQGNMSVPQMQTVRKVLSDAAKSADDAERRMASIMLKKFDDFTSPLAPPLSEARQLYHAAKNAEKLETARELAASRAGQFSGSGYQNALQTEYRGIDRNIIKGNERGFSPAEEAAIGKVANGTPVSRAARNVGRMAPTGPVSFMASAGLPYAIGSSIGGPPLGAAAATVTSGLGYLGRGIATKLGSQAADQAELLARNSGGPVTSGLDPEFIRNLLLSLGIGTAANNLSQQRN